MNFLAHAYLSFGDAEILAGNMISDFVKGSSRFMFSGKIQKGIMLHREIDEFTDAHPATKKAKEFFRPHYRLYSGAIMDVLYDHFLANDETNFTDEGLKEFTLASYRQLENPAFHLPGRFLQVFEYMKAENWLYNYRQKEGIRKSLYGLVRRAKYLSESDTAYNLFIQHYVSLLECYQDFFPDVKQFAKEKFSALI
jgi:acyl carrier protein phosphodiesterase